MGVIVTVPLKDHSRTTSVRKIGEILACQLDKQNGDARTETLAQDIGAMTKDVPVYGLVPAPGELSTGGPL